MGSQKAMAFEKAGRAWTSTPQESGPAEPAMSHASTSPRRRRVLYIESNRDTTVGGSPRALLWIVERLDRTKYEPVVLFYRDNTMVPVFQKVCETHVIDRFAGFVIARDWPLGARLMNSNRVLGFLMRLIQAICNRLVYEGPQLARVVWFFARLRPDIVHLNNGPMDPDCLILAKLLRAKCVAHYRGLGATTALRNRLTIGRYDRIICISKTVYAHAQNSDPSLKNLELLYDGVDGDKVRADAQAVRSDIRREMNHPSGPLVGLVNHIRWWKGQHVLVEAMGVLRDRVPELKAVLVGDVSNLPADVEYASRLHARVKELGIEDRVYFAGYRTDVASIFDAMDIVVQTSVENEGFGLVTIEAMSLGKPVIGSNFGPNPELIIEGDCGLLVPKDDGPALAAAIESLVRDAELRHRLGRGARARADYFSVRANVDNIEQLYQRLFEPARG